MQKPNAKSSSAFIAGVATNIPIFPGLLCDNVILIVNILVISTEKIVVHLFQSGWRSIVD